MAQKTVYSSSISFHIAHPCYKEIIAMGKPAIPLILRELRERPSFWFIAIKELSGETGIKGMSFD